MPSSIRIHLAGRWAERDLRVRHVESTRPIIPQVELLIEQAWQEAVARPGVHLFDGPMCRHEAWRVDGRELHLNLSRTSYRIFLGTNLANPQLADRYGAGVLANPVGVSPALLSGDGFLLMGLRNERVAYYPNRIHPFAGAVDPDSDGDLFAAVRRELREELSLGDDEIADVCCTGIAEDVQLRQPEVIFAVRSTLRREEIEQRLDRAEHGESWAIPAEPSHVRLAMYDPRLTPVAVAALALWSRLEF